MVEGVHVKFRWFRTIETTAETIQLVSPARDFDSVDLVWNSLKLVYESEATLAVCGKHKGTLVIDDRRFCCEKFTIVPTTLEVNIFVRDNGITAREPFNDRNQSHNRKSDDISSFFNVNRNNSLSFLSDSASLASSRSINVYEEMLEAKDDQIDNLQLQLDQLKLALVTTEAENSKLRTIKSDENVGFDVSNVEFDSEARKPPESVEIAEILNEMRTLRNQLHSYSCKNKELYKEMFKLRAENTKLQTERLRKPRFQLKSTDSVYYSDPESCSTQYKELPLTRLSRSLPATLVPTAKSVPSRRRHFGTNLVCDDDTPLSTESLQTDEFLSYGTPRKVVSAVQTDITAIKGLPKRYRSGSKDVSVKRSLFHEKRGTNHRSEDEENDDSEDTEELLQEADRFIMKVYGGSEPIIDQHNYGRSCALTSPHNQCSCAIVLRTSSRPFMPKCALDIKIGNTVRYLGSKGRVSQGIVTFVGPISGRVGTFIGIQNDGDVSDSFFSSTPCADIVPFKKVIFTWEKQV